MEKKKKNPKPFTKIFYEKEKSERIYLRRFRITYQNSYLPWY